MSSISKLFIKAILINGALSSLTSCTFAEPVSPSFDIGGAEQRIVGEYSKDKQVEVYRGIPFAEPPVGALRWGPTKDLSQRSTPITATEFGPACMQGDHIGRWYQDVIKSFGGDPESFAIPQVSEDCLYLNIWRPAQSTVSQDRLPVLVFMHGGSNKGGWSYEPNYYGENLAKKGIIVVTIAYRLGVFGFFSHPELQHANFALLDQIAALKWLKNNIAAVGGDPDLITVSGESAGANNLSYLMASPLAQGLFQRVIYQSGGWAVEGTQYKHELDAKGLELSELVGEQHDSNPASNVSIAKLRSLPASQVLNAAGKTYVGHFFDPVIDEQSISESVQSLMAKSKLPKVDLLIGSNANESRMYIPKGTTLQGWLTDNYPAEKVAEIQTQLELSSTELELLDQLMTAQSYACPSIKVAQSALEKSSNVWMYYFSKVRDSDLAREMGAYHGAELPYMFGTHDDWLPTDQSDWALSDAMMDYWAQFVKTGNPNFTGSTAWPNYDADNESVLQLDSAIKAIEHPSKALCELL